MRTTMESSAIIESVALYLWIRAVPVLAVAALLLLAGLAAVFSRHQSRRTEARVVLDILVNRRTTWQRKRRRRPFVTGPAAREAAWEAARTGVPWESRRRSGRRR
ncbi:MAG: hypothetical protein M3R63_23820 [Actinomycetota bacterium]|nr:hypothetical protein [Actinomycetota bacterium]